MTTYEVRSTLNPAELDLIMAAKAGDSQAEAQLWSMHEGAMRKAHDYGRTGLKCGKGARSKYALSFEEAMYEVYETFRTAVRLYKPSAGASFRTYLTQKLKYAALDRIESSKTTCKIAGESVEVNLISWEELIETAGVEDDDVDYSNEEIVQTQVGLYDESAQARGKMLEAFLTCADECDGKPVTADICNRLGCTKQNYSTQMRAIARDMLNHGITPISKAA